MMEERLDAMLREAQNANSSVFKRGCWNSSCCGFGYRVNAKQSMRVSTFPEALRHGATLVHRLCVRQPQHAGNKITCVLGEGSRVDGRAPSGTLVEIKARQG